jgi:predicted lipoprotein
MKRALLWLGGLLLLAGFFWRFPLFQVVSSEHATKQANAATFNAEKFAEKFWDDRLPAVLPDATPADVLVTTLHTNAITARKQFSRSVGVTESYVYFMSGVGRVLAMSDDVVDLAITPGATNAEVSLQTGLIFGNAVRDGTGLLNVNDYPNSQDFNAISEALNRIVETRVQPHLREQAKVGATIRFVGCAEVNDESTDLKPLKVIPVAATVE